MVLEGIEGGGAADQGESPGRLASARDPVAETPDALARSPSANAPDWREGFFVVPALPGLSDGTEGGGG